MISGPGSLGQRQPRDDRLPAGDDVVIPSHLTSPHLTSDHSDLSDHSDHSDLFGAQAEATYRNTYLTLGGSIGGFASLGVRRPTPCDARPQMPGMIIAIWCPNMTVCGELVQECCTGPG